MERLPRASLLLLSALLVLALGLRVGYLLYAPVLPVRSDASGYDAAARRMLATGSYSFPVGSQLWANDAFREDQWNAYLATKPNAFAMPGYSAFLASVYLVSGATTARFAVVRVIQIVLSVISLALLFFIVLEIVDRRAAWIALVLAALYPPNIWAPTYLLSETLFVFLLLLLAFFMARAARSSHWTEWVAVGVCTAAASYVRPIALLLPGLLILAVIWKLASQGRLNRDLPRMSLRILVSLLTLLVLMTPWVARNQLLYRTFVPLTSSSGVQAAQAAGAFGVPAPPYGLIAQNISMAGFRNDHELAVAAAAYAKHALAQIPPSLLWRARIESYFFGLLSSLTSPFNFFSTGTRLFSLSWWMQALLLVLAAVGVWIGRRNIRVVCLLLGIVVYFVVALSALSLQLSRYYYPAMLFLIALAAIALSEVPALFGRER